MQNQEVAYQQAVDTVLKPTEEQVARDEWVEMHLQANAQALMKRMEKKVCLVLSLFFVGFCPYFVWFCPVLSRPFHRP